MPRNFGLHLPSLIQLIISGAGSLLSFGACGLFLLIGLFNLINGDFTSPDVHMLFSLVWITALAGTLLLPSVVLSIRRLFKTPASGLQFPKNTAKYTAFFRSGNQMRLATGLMIFFPLLLMTGDFLSRKSNLSWIFMPPLSILVIIIPLWWVFQIGSHGLTGSSPQRNWGLISLGLVFTPWVIMLAEIILVTIVAAVLLLWLSSQPGFIEDLIRLYQRLLDAQMNPDIILRILNPYLQSPVLLITSVVVTAGLIPMLEELLKPLGMWVLVTQKLTPQEGFTAGLICGGIFAMLESLGMMASFTGEGWAALAIGRMGTGILHSLATALIGWGLAVAWGKRNFLKLGVIYLASVSLHGLWNAISLTLAFEPIINPGIDGNPFLTALPSISILILITLVVLLLVMLAGCNRILRREQALARPD